MTRRARAVNGDKTWPVTKAPDELRNGDIIRSNRGGLQIAAIYVAQDAPGPVMRLVFTDGTDVFLTDTETPVEMWA